MISTVDQMIQTRTNIERVNEELKMRNAEEFLRSVTLTMEEDDDYLSGAETDCDDEE